MKIMFFQKKVDFLNNKSEKQLLGLLFLLKKK